MLVPCPCGAARYPARMNRMTGRNDPTTKLLKKRNRRIEELFNNALALAPAAREAFLDRVCAGDESLRSELTALLSAERLQTASILKRRDLPNSLLADSLLNDSLLNEPPPVLQRLSLALGDHVGQYRIEQVLGTGGMGVVVRAEHLQLHTPVAIKFLLPELLGDERVLARFLREARAAVTLKSEHVRRVFDVGTLASGVPYMVMEYLEGNDFHALLRERGRLLAPFVVDSMLQACEALADAHSHGMVHRDIKPSNIFLCSGPGGVPLLKVVDFGISKAVAPIGHELTHRSAVIGTPPYMSPEQLESSKYADARSDIWALGIVLYELVSGHRPFRSESFAGLVMMVAREPMPPLEDVALPTGLEEIIAKCLAKNPAHRYQNIAELAAALAPYAATRGQAQRSTERTAAMLGLPVVRAPLSILPRKSPREHSTPEDEPLSTVRSSQGESREKSQGRSRVTVAAGIVALLGIAIGVWAARWDDAGTPATIAAHGGNPAGGLAGVDAGIPVDAQAVDARTPGSDAATDIPDAGVPAPGKAKSDKRRASKPNERRTNRSPRREKKRSGASTDDEKAATPVPATRAKRVEDAFDTPH